MWLDTVITQQLLHQTTLMEKICLDMFTVAVGEVQRSPILVYTAGHCIHEEVDTTQQPVHNETDILRCSREAGDCLTRCTRSGTISTVDSTVFNVQAIPRHFYVPDCQERKTGPGSVCESACVSQWRLDASVDHACIDHEP